MSENTGASQEQKNASRGGGNNKNRGNYRNTNNYNGKRRSGKNYSGKRNYNNDRDRKGGEDRKKQRPAEDSERVNAEGIQIQPKEQRHGKPERSEGGNFKKKREKNFNPQPKKKQRHEETVEDIRTDNARITKEIYLEISSIKDIKLD